MGAPASPTALIGDNADEAVWVSGIDFLLLSEAFAGPTSELTETADSSDAVSAEVGEVPLPITMFI